MRRRDTLYSVLYHSLLYLPLQHCMSNMLDKHHGGISLPGFTAFMVSLYFPVRLHGVRHGAYHRKEHSFNHSPSDPGGNGAWRRSARHM